MVDYGGLLYTGTPTQGDGYYCTLERVLIPPSGTLSGRLWATKTTRHGSGAIGTILPTPWDIHTMGIWDRVLLPHGYGTILLRWDSYPSGRRPTWMGDIPMVDYCTQVPYARPFVD
ncbi:hypothetical protein G9A89_000327 [Geosiphon pyriformis]|nr:hypothetical protein G9A89_000327 [Geosiphon pyriformis]